jgi:hypothetical protein
VYDANWLCGIVSIYGGEYGYTYSPVKKAVMLNDQTLDPKTSAGIIFNALAKELNGGKVGTEAIFINIDGNYEAMSPNNLCGFGLVRFVDAQKAIDIFNQHFPEVLKNYFA